MVKMDRREFLQGSLAAIIVGCAGPNLTAMRRGTPTEAIGKIFPRLAQYDQNPLSATFREYIGPRNYMSNLLFLNVWASWCQPCLRELRDFQRAQEIYPNVQALAFDSSVDSDWHVVEDYKLTFPLLSPKGFAPFTFNVKHNGRIITYEEGRCYDDLGERLFLDVYGIDAVPTTFIIPSGGVVAEVVTGAMNWRTLEKKIKQYTKPF